MAWSKAVEAIANSVSEIAKTITAYGPNEEGKVVKAARKAGTKAKQLVKTEYPKTETEKEYQKKIVPRNLEGVTNRQQYLQLRAQEMEYAYQQAYDRIIELYHERLVKESGGQVPYDPVDQLADESEQNSEQNHEQQKNKMGCVLFTLLLSAPSIGGLVYILVN